MNKVYPLSVIEAANNILSELNNSRFFIENQIDDIAFAKKYFLDKFTQHFINGNLLPLDEYIVTDDFEQSIKEIIAGSILYSLKSKGFVDSYEDENTEEVFFLTENGKIYLKELNGKLHD